MIKNYSEQESVDNFGAIQYDREQKHLNQKDLEQAQTNIGVKNIIDCVHSNSASWGGSTPTGGNSPVLFHKHYYYDPYGSTYDENFVSGSSELNFRCGVNFNTQPQEISITRNGSEITRVYWTLVSSDGSNNYYIGSVNSLPTNDELGLVAGNSYTFCYMSANGNEISLPYFNGVACPTSTNAKFNIQGMNITGRINGMSLGGTTTLTSFTGSLNDFTFSGYELYDCMITSEIYDNTYYYDVSAEFGGVGGSQVTSGDVLPNGPMDGNTYTLKWNTQSGLYWGI